MVAFASGAITAAAAAELAAEAGFEAADAEIGVAGCPSGLPEVVLDHVVPGWGTRLW
jgi:hypothetical protein